MQRNKSCDQNQGTGLKAMTNPDINVKLESGKCQSVRFSLTVRDYKSFFFFFFLHGIHLNCTDQPLPGTKAIKMIFKGLKQRVSKLQIQTIKKINI